MVSEFPDNDREVTSEIGVHVENAATITNWCATPTTSCVVVLDAAAVVNVGNEDDQIRAYSRDSFFELFYRDVGTQMDHIPIRGGAGVRQ